jgi:hypothetical protein
MSRPLPAHEAKKYTFDLADTIERLAKERGVEPTTHEGAHSALTDVFGEDPLVGSFFRMEPAGKRGEPIVFYKEGGELRPRASCRARKATRSTRR